jgi:hypothetical protein
MIHFVFPSIKRRSSRTIVGGIKMKTLFRSGILLFSPIVLLFLTVSLFSKERVKVDPFSMQIKALQGQNALDVYATFSTSDPTKYPLPPSIKKFQVKIFNQAGHVAFIRSEKSVNLTGNQLVFTIPGRFDNDTLRVLADVESPHKIHQKDYDDNGEDQRAGRTKPEDFKTRDGDIDEQEEGFGHFDKEKFEGQELEEWTSVRLRPDLKISSIQAPTEQNINLPFTVEVFIQEINMQTAATCDVSLYREGSLIHTTMNVAVAAGGNASVVFTGLSYPSVGVQNYSAVISNVNPRDYDSTNNAREFSITFTNPAPQVAQSNYYFHYEKQADLFDEHYVAVSNGQHILDNHTEDNSESFIYQTSIDNPPITTSTPVSAAFVIIRSDGSVIQNSFADVPLSNSNADSSVYQVIDTVNHISLTIRKYSNTCYSSIERYMSNYVYYYDDHAGVSYYFSGGSDTSTIPNQDSSSFLPTSSFLNEDNVLKVSLVTTFGDYKFGGGAAINLTTTFTQAYVDTSYRIWDPSLADSVNYTLQSFVKNGMTTASGVTDVTFVPKMSQKSKAKISAHITEAGLPKEFRLNQNYPNPFNPTTSITFALPKNSFVNIKVYDMLGREVKTLLSSDMPAGNHGVQWRGDDNGGRLVSSGTYIYRIAAENFVSTKKMILMK